MELVDAKQYNPNCDWKLLCENFMEWYHLPPVHPELAKYSTVAHHHKHQGRGNFCAFVTSPLTDSGGAADSHNFKLTPSATSRSDTAYFYHIFPNYSVTIYPHSVYTLIMTPTAPGQSSEELGLLQHPECRLETDSDEI